jgi:hypothetical protein
VSDIHAITDDEEVGADEADVVGFQRLGELARLFQKHGDGDAAGAALEHEVAGEGERAPRLEDVVDEQDVAPLDVGLHVANQRYLPGRRGARLVARQGDELDLGR